MKIRISGNSIRLRLKQTEVKVFRQEGEIKEVTAFGTEPEDELIFVITMTSADEFQVRKSANTIAVEVPDRIANEWTQTDLTGFEVLIDTGKGKTIKVLVEKDFKCLDGSDKDNEDSYPNPSLQC